MLPGQVLLTPVALMSTLPHQIRLIGGQWKRTRLGVPGMPGLRPTPDRVRETLFNWLGQDLAGWRALDAFAGTGALGLEAASRGAQSVLLVEQDARASGEKGGKPTRPLWFGTELRAGAIYLSPDECTAAVVGLDGRIHTSLRMDIKKEISLLKN